MSQAGLSRPVLLLGLAGWLPQIACLWLAMSASDYQGLGPVAGCFYAAIILSFLGGLWWMAGLLSGDKRAWIPAIAVVPSLAAWAALMPLALGWPPRPSLLALGVLLLLSPPVDARLSRKIAFPDGWLRLRVQMASGLGLLTLLLALA